MAKYNYDKSVLKGLGVGAFLGEVKLREQHIAEAPANEIKTEYQANIVAKSLHPHYQMAKVAEVTELKDAKLFKLVPDAEKGTDKLAYFRAGQYISVIIQFEADENGIAPLSTKPYSLCSSPKSALTSDDNHYCICVKKSATGYASEYILNNWKEGSEVVISGPLGHFYFQELRDSDNVVATAGGSGITPFLSMAKAIADGIEKFNLTILYGSKTEADILFKDELDEITAKSNGKVKVVHVLSDEKKEGYEEGFITAELIKKYGSAMGKDYSLYVCGPKQMYKFMHGEVAKLGLSERRARFEVAGEYGDPTASPEYKGNPDVEYKLVVLARGESKTITCKGSETIMEAVQKAGIVITSDCRSGECGWCHSRLICGDVFVPSEADGRRMADKKFGWIHPCVTYPLSDVEIEVFPVF